MDQEPDSNTARQATPGLLDGFRDWPRRYRALGPALGSVLAGLAAIVAVFGVIAASHIDPATPAHPTVQESVTRLALATPFGVAPAPRHSPYPPGCGLDGSGANGGAGGAGGWFGGSPGGAGQAAQNGHCGKNGANGTNRVAPLVFLLIAVLALGIGLFLVIRRRSRNNRVTPLQAEE